METFDKVSHSAHEAFDKVADATSHAAEAIGKKGEQFKNAEQQMVKNCRGYIREYPIMSVGIAAAAGFLLSRLLSKSPN
ncbi:DUF883 family protein [Methylotuvimicrobium buryatense]|uniref:DUF883 family protein n=1 Tax=Methylotuvimicrobium buryatense TaxID=95641 RepID=A0A4P9US81_METBY|nr:hypothetical protein [Methylotuvimicrobium buryatense]QCW83370.1 hypothetical protein EQU24_14805 [Methylotuvimicrobium buryatense]